MSDRIPFEAALAAQAELLEKSAESVAEALAGFELPPWMPRDTVGVVAMGASSHSGIALVHALAEVGIRAVNLSASDLLGWPEGFQPADHYVVVSESGRSRETVEATRRLTRGRRIGIVNYPDSPLGEEINFTLPLGEFRDSSPYTVGYTATLVAYSLLMDAAGVRGAAAAATRIPTAVREFTRHFKPASMTVAESLRGLASVDFVGSGMGFSSACEGALLFRESARIPAAAYESHQYLHGPIEGARRGAGVVLIGDGRELPLAGQLLSAGVHVVLLTKAPAGTLSHAEESELQIIHLDPTLSGLALASIEVVAVQMIVESFAKLEGLTLGQMAFHHNDTKLNG